jgi:hypothetical protein
MPTTYCNAQRASTPFRERLSRINKNTNYALVVHYIISVSTSLGAQAPAEQQLLLYTFQFGQSAFTMTPSRVFMDFSMDNSPLGRFLLFHPSDFLHPKTGFLESSSNCSMTPSPRHQKSSLRHSNLFFFFFFFLPRLTRPF